MDQVEARIEQMFLQNRRSWILQWILLYLQERLMEGRRAEAGSHRRAVRYGCSSPVMYLEAFLILKKDPFLLRKLDTFECRVLRFAARQKLLTPELAEQTGNLALHRRSWSRGLFEILTECYAVNPSGIF